MNERIKEIRLYLGLTQDEFAKLLKLQRNTITLVENGKRNLSSRTIDYLCDKCNINKDWLETGHGNMINDNLNIFSLEEFAKDKNLSTEEIDIIKCYLELDPHIRKTLITHFKSYFQK
uniref:helix-turn-helix domain-containing protein n=1 Tax=Acetatifactor sp. TaxID=1872090 RepID=UPI0040572F66